MKRYLYILRYKTTPLLIFENESMKYFDEDNKENIVTLERYLKDKIEYESLRIIDEKQAIYHDEEYIVRMIEIVNLNGINDDKNIRQLSTIKNEELEYKDELFLKIFYLGGFHKYKCGNVNDKEKRNIKLNIILSIIIAIISTVFFISGDRINYLGISVPIVTILITLASLYSMEKIRRINYIGLYFTASSVLLSITYGIYNNSIFRTINIILIPITLLTGLYMINFYNIKFNYAQLINNILPSITINIISDSHIEDIFRLFRGKEKVNILNNKNKGILKGILISIPLLIVLIILLASADQMFENIIENAAMYIEDSLINFNFIFSGLRIITVILVFIYMFYIFLSFKFRVDDSKVRSIKTLEKNMVNTILILVNVLYFLFTYVQVKYLYIKSNSHLTAEEYSSYARSGFFQLMIVVVINIIIIIYFKNRVKDSKLTNILNTFMTVISINMGAASLYKMMLYIGEFGLTQLRFMTSIFMIFIIIMLTVITVSLWRNVELFKWFIIVGSMMYISINYCNMDKIIAEYNLSEEAKQIDISYLSNLSLDSYDVVLKAYKEGKIDEEQFSYYIAKKVDTSKWYEYNYYNNKM